MAAALGLEAASEGVADVLGCFAQQAVDDGEVGAKDTAAGFPYGQDGQRNKLPCRGTLAASHTKGRGRRTCEVANTDLEHPDKSRRADGTGPQSDREQQAQAQLPVLHPLQAQDGPDGQQEYPQVKYQVRHVGEEREATFAQAVALGSPPPRCDGTAGETECNFERDDPQSDDNGGGLGHDAEFWRHEDAVVEREDGELGEADAHVVEVAEDVVALFASNRECLVVMPSGRDMAYLSEEDDVLLGHGVNVPPQSMGCR